MNGRPAPGAIVVETVAVDGFRNLAPRTLELAATTTAVIGANGQGKTNLLEAIAHLAGTSLRGATSDAMIALGAERAVVRAEGRRGGRPIQVEAELVRSGRDRIQLNRQPVRRVKDLAEGLRVSIFAPDDLALVKGGPAGRRRWLDEAVAALDPRLAAPQTDLDRILRQRNALLRQSRGRLDEAGRTTLDVWDERLARTGTAVHEARAAALATLGPAVAAAYADVADVAQPVGLDLVSGFGTGSLSGAVAAARDDDLRRGSTTVGPHRAELLLTVDGLPGRTHGSQGEQRSLALALRLAVHRAVTDRLGVAPVLLLDDVFSELDHDRTARLLAHLPAGQTILTSAVELPPGVTPDATLRVEAGVLREAA